MAKGKPIRKHSDKNFIKGFERYSIIENTILNSESWSFFLKKLEARNKSLAKSLWQEYQLINGTILIEQQLAELCYSLAQKEIFKDKQITKNSLLWKIKEFRFKKKSIKEAEKLLIKKVGRDEK